MLSIIGVIHYVKSVLDALRYFHASNIMSSGNHLGFSSRRRHTSLQGDWGSDVCSSDLAVSLRAPPRA